MYQLAVIGGGASGLCAAIAAKRKNPEADIIILEALPRIGKKILATGNGRCNLTNLSASVKDYNTDFVSDVFLKFPPEKIIDFFSGIGLLTIADGEGRVYPLSNTAASVLDCLRFEAENIGIIIRCDFHADTIIKKDNTFIINGEIRTRNVILASGGKASPSQGSDGSGYTLLKKLGHTVTPLYAGLVQLTVSENVKALKGVRVKASAELFSNGKKLNGSKGEVLFTDYGLSGIAIMDLSRNVKDGKYTCTLDILPTLPEKEIKAFIFNRKKENSSLSVENVLCGILPKKAGQYILKVCSVKADTPVGRLDDVQLKHIAEKMKKLTFNITGNNGFANAQITVGGARLSEFDSRTLESKKIKGLYCVGELLDVDSVCGGYNLQWAWASGLTAGENAVK